MEITLLLEFTERKQFRDWLQENHSSAKECWVVLSRSKNPPSGVLPYLDVVEEALCFGWIDSTLKKLPGGRLAQRLSPRRKNSHWTELNKQRYRELERRGLMTLAGRKALFGNTGKIKIVILDFDGTLADTADVIIKTTQATIKELGLPSRTNEECAAMIGLRLAEIPSVLFPDCGIDGDLYAQTYRRLFHEFNTEDAVRLYPHVVETLTALKNMGIILTIASSRSHASLDDYVENLGLSSLISHILGADDVNRGKPDPEPVIKTLERFGISPEKAIVVGDTSFDIHMGKNAYTRTCAVTYGNGSRESLSDADWIIDNFALLLDIINA